jgi:hypothetical protein
MSSQDKKAAQEDAEDKLSADQEIAVYSFLPFVGDLFGKQTLQRRAGKPLPMRTPNALGLEVVEALEQVMPRGVLAFLTRRAGGWRAISIARPGQEAPLRNVRLLDPKLWGQGALRLSFGEESIDALLVSYHASCQPVQVSTAKTAEARKARSSAYPDVRLNKCGDLIIHHLAFSRLWESQMFLRKGIEETELWDYFIKNPLTSLCLLRADDACANAGLARLWADDLLSLWPWLERYVRACWLRELESRWEELERFDRLNQALAAWTRAMLDVAKKRGRRDLLAGLMSFYQTHLVEGAEEAWHREFDRLARSLKFAERDKLRRVWARWVEVGYLLEREYQTARGIHPLDRESPDRVFMEEYERLGYGIVAGRAYGLANVLNSVIT